jgi:hypothetical protein
MQFWTLISFLCLYTLARGAVLQVIFLFLSKILFLHITRVLKHYFFVLIWIQFRLVQIKNIKQFKLH